MKAYTKKTKDFFIRIKSPDDSAFLLIASLTLDGEGSRRFIVTSSSFSLASIEWCPLPRKGSSPGEGLQAILFLVQFFLHHMTSI